MVGPWSDISIRPDLEAALDLNLTAEKERLEQQAEDAVRSKVAEELNVTDEVQDLEEAAKDKAGR